FVSLSIEPLLRLKNVLTSSDRFSSACPLGRANKARHDGAGARCTSVLCDLYGKHLRRTHLLVQELHNPGQLLRNLVRHEQHADSTRAQIGLHLAPEAFRITFAQKVEEKLFWVLPRGFRSADKRRDDLLDRPVGHSV